MATSDKTKKLQLLGGGFATKKQLEEQYLKTYVLDEGETVEDAPEWAEEVVDPYSESEGVSSGCITGTGAPTTATKGDVGDFYMDTLTGAVYKCTAVNEGVYTWADLSVADLTGAIDEQTGRIYSEIPITDWEIGTISSSNGENGAANPKRIRTGYILVKQGDTVFADEGAQLYVYIYDATTKVLTSSSGAFVNSCTLTDECYIRIVGRNNADTTITDVDGVSSLIHISESGGVAFVTRYLLKNNDDLNTVTQAGVYNLASTSMPTNAPANESGVLTVYKSNKRVEHVLYTLTSIYTRHSADLGGTWTAWSGVANDTNALISRRLLTAEDDLNAIKDIGIYRYASSSLPPNAPGGIGGVLVVNRCGIAIEQVVYGTEIGYCRHTSNALGTTWGRWNKMYDYNTSKIQQLPVLALTGDTSAMTKDNAVPLNYTLFGVSGECTCKWQGSSSQRYDKKNYTIKFDTAIDGWNKWATFVNNQRAVNGNVSRIPLESRWGEQKKFCIKANWVDPSHARNIVCARLWGQIVQNRITKGEITDNRTIAPNYGAIDGFPIEITINGDSVGLFTFNIPKDAWQFAMGDAVTEYVICGEGNANQATRWKALAVMDEEDFSLEYTADDVENSTVLSSLNTAIQGAIDAGADWETTLAPYVDINSVFDYFIFTCCINNHDALARNILYGTYDGMKWFMSAYDMDTTFGVDPYGTSWFNVKTDRTQFAEAASIHRLAYLMYTYSKDKLAARYNELRETVLSDENVWHELSQFIVDIPSRNYDIDRNIWITMPGTSCANMAQYMEYYRMHCALLDKEIEALNQ